MNYLEERDNVFADQIRQMHANVEKRRFRYIFIGFVLCLLILIPWHANEVRKIKKQYGDTRTNTRIK